MEEYLAWISAQNPQKKCEAWWDKQQRREMRDAASLGRQHREQRVGRMGGVGSHQGELVDLHVERLQLPLADLLLRVLGEELERLQVNSQPVHLHVPAGVQPEVRLGHP